MPFNEIQVQVSSRETATAIPDMVYLVNDLQVECNESTGLQTQVIEGGVGPTLLSQGSIAKGRNFFLIVIEDDTNGKEELNVMINGASNDAWAGTMFAYEADTTTGIVSVHITNAGSNSIKFKWMIAGDVV